MKRSIYIFLLVYAAIISGCATHTSFTFEENEKYQSVVKGNEVDPEKILISTGDIADKIYRIGSYSETSQAKATGMTLELGAESLNNSFTFLNPAMTSTVIDLSTTAGSQAVDVVKESLVENNELVTPTLAKVYLEQEHYEKAISAYKKLSLKYPKKNSFFANQIKLINKLNEK